MTKSRHILRRWSSKEDAFIRDWYARPSGPLETAILAHELGRTLEAVWQRAYRLGCTDQQNRVRPRVETPKVKPRQFATQEALRAHQSEAAKARIAANGHPRGALGLIQTAVSRAKMSVGIRRAWANPLSGLNAPALRQAKSDRLHLRHLAGELDGGYSRAAGGRRADLGGRYFRSSWEANYARYLVFIAGRGLIAGWAYESKVFEFQTIKRGTRSYTPDFRIDYTDGRHEWHEVKGWMDDKSRVRLARMAKFYPDEKVVVIDEAWFKRMNRGLAGVIPGWERKRRA